MDLLLAPFQFAFMQNAFLIAVIISVPTAILSCFLVLKGWALMGDAISHAVLPGIVLSYIFGLPLMIGAFFAGLFCALATGFISENSRIKRDTVMGVVFSGMFALGLVLYTQIETDVHLDHILFGNILGVGSDDIFLTLGIALLVSAIIFFKRRDFLLESFDPAQARALGLNVRLLHYALLIMISLCVVAALKAVGLILAIAFLVAPGGIAFLVTKRFDAMMWVAILVATLSSILGVYVSFFIDSAPAPTIVLIMTVGFILALMRALHRNKITTQLN